jgi:transketolase
MTDYSQNLRRRFADETYKVMKKNKNIVVLTGDLGYKIWDQIRQDFPDRFYNVGAAEQALIGISVGLALEGKIPVVFSITPFLLYRPFETIRNYVNHEKIPIILVGS